MSFIHSTLKRFFASADGEVFSYTLKQPVGVCGLILPWNVPIIMFVAKVVTALAAGNILLSNLSINILLGTYPLKLKSIIVIAFPPFEDRNETVNPKKTEVIFTFRKIFK